MGSDHWLLNRVRPATEKEFNRRREFNGHPHSGWLGFYRQRRQKTGARSAPIVVGETG